MVKNLNSIVKELIDGHQLLNIRLQEILPVGKWSHKKILTLKKLILFEICDKYSKRPPPKSMSHFFLGERGEGDSLPPFLQLSLNSPFFSIPSLIYQNTQQKLQT